MVREPGLTHGHLYRADQMLYHAVVLLQVMNVYAGRFWSIWFLTGIFWIMRNLGEQYVSWPANRY